MIGNVKYDLEGLLYTISDVNTGDNQQIEIVEMSGDAGAKLIAPDPGSGGTPTCDTGSTISTSGKESYAYIYPKTSSGSSFKIKYDFGGGQTYWRRARVFVAFDEYKTWTGVPKGDARTQLQLECVGYNSDSSGAYFKPNSGGILSGTPYVEAKAYFVGYNNFSDPNDQCQLAWSPVDGDPVTARSARYRCGGEPIFKSAHKARLGTTVLADGELFPGRSFK